MSTRPPSARMLFAKALGLALAACGAAVMTFTATRWASTSQVVAWNMFKRQAMK